jgi:hypothetical protein
VILGCRKWWPPDFIRQCLDILKADGSYDRIVVEATATEFPDRH